MLMCSARCLILFPSGVGGVIPPSFVVEVGEDGLLFMLVDGGVGSLAGDSNESLVLLLAFMCSASVAVSAVLVAAGCSSPRLSPY